MPSIYVTGDIHGEANRLNLENFPEQKEMVGGQDENFVIICGDFGLVWNQCCESKHERWWLNWLENKPFTTLWVDGNHECFHKDTEVLTDIGWVNIATACANIENYNVASVDMQTHRINYSKPLNFTKQYAKTLIDFNGSNYRQCVTPGHAIIVNGQKIRADQAMQMDLRESHFRYTVDDSQTTGIDLQPKTIELLTAIIMDATIVDYKKYNAKSNKVRIQFHLKKERKVDYIKRLLTDNDIKYTSRYTNDESYYINVYGDDARFLYNALDCKKEIPASWRDLNSEQFDAFLVGLTNTDGRALTNTTVWRTISKNDVDIVTELCVKHNYDINVRVMDNASGYVKDKCQYKIALGKNKRIDHKMKINEVDYDDYVYCLTMCDGTLITRFNLLPCITGNCFDRLYSSEYPIEEWHGGKVQKIRPHVIHLMRGECYDILGKKFFAFGGASSHDIRDGILDPIKDKELIKEWSKCYYKLFRVNHVSWWEQELASDEEMQHGRDILAKNNNCVDFIITHCAPQDVCYMLALGGYQADKMTLYFNELARTVQFKRWYCGHYHCDQRVMGKFDVMYENIHRVV